MVVEREVVVEIEKVVEREAEGMKRIVNEIEKEVTEGLPLTSGGGREGGCERN